MIVLSHIRPSEARECSLIVEQGRVHLLEVLLRLLFLHFKVLLGRVLFEVDAVEVLVGVLLLLELP